MVWGTHVTRKRKKEGRKEYAVFSTVAKLQLFVKLFIITNSNSMSLA